MRQLRNSQIGAASLITVIILSIILTLVTTGLLRLSIQEARQSIDDELSNRAYFAAESGLTDAVVALRANAINPAAVTLNEDTCDPAQAPGITSNVLSSVDELDITYTCQLITTNPDTINAELVEDESISIPLNKQNGGNIGGLIIRWHNMVAETDQIAFRNSVIQDLPRRNAWNSGGDTFPALLRAEVYSVPSWGSVSRANLTQHQFVGFLNPTDNGADSGLAGLSGQILNADCSQDINNAGPDPAATNFACRFEITGGFSANRDYFIRLRPTYRGAHIQLAFSDGSSFDGAQARIDVTGRSSDVYRRIQAVVDISQDPDKLPDYAILSGEEICKRLGVGDNEVTDNCGL